MNFDSTTTMYTFASLPPTNIVGDGTTTTPAIPLSFDSRAELLMVTLDETTGGSVVLQLEEADESGGPWQNVSADNWFTVGDVTGTLPEPWAVNVGYIGKKKFIRLNITLTGLLDSWLSVMSVRQRLSKSPFLDLAIAADV